MQAIDRKFASEENAYTHRSIYWRLLRTNRDFRLLYLGTLISLGGDWFLTVALLDEPASHAALPNLVKSEHLGAANVLMGSTWGTMLAAVHGGQAILPVRTDRSVCPPLHPRDHPLRPRPRAATALAAA